MHDAYSRKWIPMLVLLAGCADSSASQTKSNDADRPTVEARRSSADLRLTMTDDRPHESADAEQAAKIRALIRDFESLDEPRHFISHWMSPMPLQGFGESDYERLDRLRLDSCPALREIVSIGPRALPFLLEALDDPTPTGITIKKGQHGLEVWFDEIVDFNSLNLREQACQLSNKSKSTIETDDIAPEFTLKVGDICYVAIGLIVGRSYEAARYAGPMGVAITSPGRSPELAAKIRSIWSAPNPSDFLLRSLLFDYATMEILLESRNGSRLQYQTAARLLQYYPDETRILIAKKLESLVVEDTSGDVEAWKRRDTINGTRTVDFVRITCSSSLSEIRAAATEIFAKTTDQEIRLAALPAVDDEALIATKLEPVLYQLRSAGFIRDPVADHLRAWIKASPRTAKRAIQAFIMSGEAERHASVCEALRSISPEWKAEILCPILDDKRDLRHTGAPVFRKSRRMRICDLAAEVLVRGNPTLELTLEGSDEFVDQQIGEIRQKIDGRR